MIFNRLNIKSELVKERSRQQRLMNDVTGILNESLERDKDVLNRLKNSGSSSSILVNEEDENRIYTLDQIRKICIRYRLRFLSTSLFKATFPYEAISRINELEKKLNRKIDDFRIIAPSKAFDLENINQDPLLFAQLADGRYYLIHHWGKDLKWYRRILTWPLQNFTTYFISLWILAAILSFGIPGSVMHLLSRDSELFLRLWLTVHSFIAFMGITFWLAMSYEKTFSSLNWESKYYNW
ncbi:MAG: hypothetical protein ACO1G9_13705 [Bacteroidota bacterium]